MPELVPTLQVITDPVTDPVLVKLRTDEGTYSSAVQYRIVGTNIFFPLVLQCTGNLEIRSVSKDSEFDTSFVFPVRSDGAVDEIIEVRFYANADLAVGVSQEDSWIIRHGGYANTLYAASIYEISKAGIVELQQHDADLNSIISVVIVEHGKSSIFILNKYATEGTNPNFTVVKDLFKIIQAASASSWTLESSEYYFPVEQGYGMILNGMKINFEDEDVSSRKTFDLTIIANGHTTVYEEEGIECNTGVVVKWNAIHVGSARYIISNCNAKLRNVKWLVYPLPVINETL